MAEHQADRSLALHLSQMAPTQRLQRATNLSAKKELQARGMGTTFSIKQSAGRATSSLA